MYNYTIFFREAQTTMSRADVIIDLHFKTEIQARDILETHWASRKWHGLRSVHIIHGDGDVLRPATRNWADEKGIPWAPENGNTGVTVLHPGKRLQTPAAPPVRPLNKTDLKEVRNLLPKQSTIPPRAHPPTEEAITDVEMMSRAFEEISKIAAEEIPVTFAVPINPALDTPAMRRLLAKHNQSAMVETRMKAPASVTPVTISRETARPEPVQAEVDPMQAEFDRLRMADTRSLRRLKVKGE